MTDIVLYVLAAIGAVTTAKWIRERWRTRHDKGYMDAVAAIEALRKAVTS